MNNNDDDDDDKDDKRVNMSQGTDSHGLERSKIIVSTNIILHAITTSVS
jgi:hypothetical protein